MLIKFNLDSELVRKIQKLIQEGKYDDIHQFIKLAISNQIEEDFSVGKQVLINSDIDIEEPVEEKAAPEELSFDYLSNLDFNEKSDVQKEKYEVLIWSFYNRFFPVRIAINCLASMIKEDNKWIELEDFQKTATDIAQEVCKTLKAYEYENNLKRNDFFYNPKVYALPDLMAIYYFEVFSRLLFKLQKVPPTFTYSLFQQS